MFELCGIVKHFGSVRALNGASLQVRPGEIQALLGSNGSGKSTIVKIMGGVVQANEGQLLMDGTPIHIGSVFESRQYGFAVAYQELSLLQQMSITDNILLGQERQGQFGLIDRRASRQFVGELLERLQLKCSPDSLVQSLSPSEQSLVEVAKALARNPKVLLLDEVTASLHHDEVEVLFRVLREEKEKGASILIVTHRMNEIYQLCDSATIFRNGETVAQGRMEDLPLDDVIYYMTGTRVEKCDETGCTTDATEILGEPLLETEHVSVAPRLRDISIHVAKSEIVGIGGLEGQGQAEYIKAVFGAIKVDSGEMRFDGNPLRPKNTAQAAKAGIAYVSGDRTKESVFSIRSIEENLHAGVIALGSVWDWVSSRRVREFADDAVEKYKIKIGDLTDAASSLSGGNQQKLAIARGIAAKPKLLLLNDPTKGVDIHSRREIHGILKSCSQNGMGVILVSSDNEELLEVCSRIYTFYEGRIVAELSGADKTEACLVRSMLGSSEIQNKREGEQ
ncbi:MAG: sugar ABC transporter ATP-binding protein [Oscillospiraceae bacterium]|nr:sugar ABC transporter ATP-binding protein [Oscillospiraceae bacterium]